MEDTHLANLCSYLKRRIDNKEYRKKHTCNPEDGYCVVCACSAELLEYWKGWIALIALEQRRRSADTKRRDS